MAEKKYLVVIGDIVQSRQLQNREQFQAQFQKALQKTKIFDASAVVSPFVVTIGDEFQGVLNNATHLFRFFNALEYTLNFMNFRYGLGIGPISTQLNKKAAIGMDGPAFYFARESLEKAKKSGLKYHFKSESEKNDTINTLLNWMNRENHKWTNQKQEIVKMVQEGYTQGKIANQMGVSQPAVSKTLKTTPVELIIQTVKIIENEINKILKDA